MRESDNLKIQIQGIFFCFFIPCWFYMNKVIGDENTKMESINLIPMLCEENRYLKMKIQQLEVQ